MRNLQTELRRGDPVAIEGGLSPADLNDMRRRVLSAKGEPPPRRVGFLLGLAAVLFVATSSGVVMTRVLLQHERVKAVNVTTDQVGQRLRVRQVQYRTPGGTRVFWTLNPNLEVR